MPSSTPLPAMALATGDPESTNHIGEAQPSPSQSAAPTVDKHARSVPSNTQLAAMALPTGDLGYTTHVMRNPLPSLLKLWQSLYKNKGYG